MMGICKCWDSLVLKFKSMLFTCYIIFSLLKYYLLCWHWLIIKSLWWIHYICILLLFLKTLNKSICSISLHLIHLMNRFLSLIIICFFLLRGSLISASSKSSRFHWWRMFKLILTMLFVRSILIYFRFL